MSKPLGWSCVDCGRELTEDDVAVLVDYAKGTRTIRSRCCWSFLYGGPLYGSGFPAGATRVWSGS